MKTELFVIEQVRSDKDRLFYHCSSEHGCGWNPHRPKQSFSKSELTGVLREMIEFGHFQNLIVRELVLS